MDEHVCKWHVVANRTGRIWARCKITCREELTIEQIDARLNEYETLKAATEALTPEQARRLAQGDEMIYVPEGARLMRYASILEGKDE